MKYIITDNDGHNKEVSKKYYDKIKAFNRNVQMFFLLCNDFDLNKRYPVKGFDLKIKGIDLLTIMDIVEKDRENPTRSLTLNNGFYFHQNGSIAGFCGINGFNSINNKP